MDKHREIEGKFDLDNDAALPAFVSLDGVASVSEPQEHRLETTYYDTPELRLVAAGITLRRRRGGDDEGWHLKLPADEARHEVRVPLDRATRTVPKRLRTPVATLVRGQMLEPVVAIETRRTSRDLLDTDGRVLAEVADDRVHLRTPSESNGVPGWREVEVEIVDGEPDLLAAAADLLQRSGAEPSPVSSKLSRALGDQLPGPRVAAPRSKKDPVAALVQSRIADQLDTMLASDPLVREDLPDAVHAMRVATRRLRCALATYRPCLGRDVTEPLREELKWLGHVLGEARDPEVQQAQMRHRLDAVVDDEPAAAEALEAARARIEAALDERYREAHQRCVEALDSDRYRALVDRLDQLVTRPTWTPRAQESIGDTATRRVQLEWKRVAARTRALGTDDRNEGLHELRKAARRLRYAVEPLTPIYGKPARRLVKEMKRVQDLLGAHHDTVTARSQLVGLAERAADEGENALVYGILHARETEDAQRLEEEFDRTWPSVSDKSRRRWLR